MKKIFTLILCFISLHLFAINVEQALLVTQNFLKEKKINENSVFAKINVQEVVQKDGLNLYYIMNLGDNDGFVIVSASQSIPPIIGYSFDSEFQWHSSIQYYLDTFSDYIINEEKSNNSSDFNIKRQWDYFLQEDFISKTVQSNESPPLITSRWNQNKFYNTYCPWDRRVGASFDYRVPNGCVALAAAQLMNYYRHPEKGKGNLSYIPYPYPQQSVYLSQHEYHWDAMCDRPTNYTNEIAKLAYHVGVMIKMGYAPGGSGANIYDLANSLENNFFYSYFPWGGYDTVTLKREIDSLRPFIMSGSNGKDGHAFLLDGYTEVPSIMFHFNWGWGGSSDGYFLLTEHFFSDGAITLINIQPVVNYPVQCQQYKRQTASQGYVTNGSTNKPYNKGPDCSWMLAAPKASRYTFSISRLDTRENIDVVSIYNGSSTSSGVAATFSGTTRPTQNTVVNADSVLITFTSSDPYSENNTHRGFLISYTTDKPKQDCDFLTNLTASSGYISDGSSPYDNYPSWTSCTWNINPNYSTGFYGLFHEFDLKLGDFIDIYNAITNPPTFLLRYDRYYPPTIGEVFSIPYSKVQIKFNTDNFDDGNGFKLQYFTILGVNENSLLENLSIYPNPASDFVNISFSSECVDQSINCRLLDVAGKEVYSTCIEYDGKNYYTQVPVSQLSKGFYLLQLTTSTGKVTSKIIVN
ncbi:MAG: C10 family peptidase [Bacteroidales bacterium]|jgi:hypothetical protein|nr:C10 family peptidase [Bacteroidales bacterium]